MKWLHQVGMIFDLSCKNKDEANGVMRTSMEGWTRWKGWRRETQWRSRQSCWNHKEISRVVKHSLQKGSCPPAVKSTCRSLIRKLSEVEATGDWWRRKRTQRSEHTAEFADGDPVEFFRETHWAQQVAPSPMELKRTVYPWSLDWWTILAISPCEPVN